ncbi:MAG: hypothetical protein C5B59_19765 [Bacteroidetes bacterium]|nr:MAG: hypothetical protein C5B59_19765 [Bacteroidota bacterium]
MIKHFEAKGHKTHEGYNVVLLVSFLFFVPYSDKKIITTPTKRSVRQVLDRYENAENNRRD